MSKPIHRLIAGCAAAIGSAAVIGFVSGYWAGADKPAANTAVQSAAPAAQATPGAQPGKTTQSLGGSAQIAEAEAYSGQHPSLMAVTLSDNISKVLARYGKPQSRFEMDNDKDPITVFEYADFSVGFSKEEVVQYIEVRTSQANPGLHGIKLGGTAADARAALGKPDTDTGYVLAYKTKTSVLKLDVDPQSKTVQSIKLFGRSQ